MGAREVAVVDAGNVGRVLTWRLAAAGHRVTLVARDRSDTGNRDALADEAA